MVFAHNKIFGCPENKRDVFFLKHESQSFIFIQFLKKNMETVNIN